MFSQQTRHFAHENTDVMQRKPTTDSAVRKPFGDRSVNLNTQNRSAKKPQDVATKKLEDFSNCNDTPNIKYPSYLSDICSKQEMLDEFWGVATQKVAFPKSGSETPTKYGRIVCEPSFLESPKDNLLRNISFDSEMSEIEEPSLPDILDFDFDD